MRRTGEGHTLFTLASSLSAQNQSVRARIAMIPSFASQVHPRQAFYTSQPSHGRNALRQATMRLHTKAKRWPVLAVVSVLVVVVAVVALVAYLLLRPRRAAQPQQSTPMVFPSRAATATVCILIPNSSSTTAPDSTGFGAYPPSRVGPVYAATGITSSGKNMLQQVAADPAVGAVCLQLATPSAIHAWIETALWLLRHDIAVFALIGQQVGSDPIHVQAIRDAVTAVKRLKDAATASQALHVGIALDFENLDGEDGWAPLTAALPPRAASGAADAIPLLLFVAKNDVGKPGLSGAVAAVDTVGVMFYRSMVASNLVQSGDHDPVNTKFTADMATPSITGDTIATLAARAGTTMMVGVETSWMHHIAKNATTIAKDKETLCATKASACSGDGATTAACTTATDACKKDTTAFWTKFGCDVLLEQSFVLGGGIPAGTSPSAFLSSPATQHAYSLHPATSPTPTLRFFVESLRPWLQLHDNLTSTTPPEGWPTETKVAGRAACVAQFEH